MAFDPQAATTAYIDGLGAAALDKAAAYTSGGHWLLLWGLVVTGVFAWIVVRWGVLSRLTARMQQRGTNLRVFLLALVAFLLFGLLTLPWTLYAEWWRESSYGRTSQPLGDFLAQWTIATLVLSLLAGGFCTGLYALMRRTGKHWWLWSGGLTAVALTLFMLGAPVLIEPLFNEYKPVPAGPVRDALVEMAQQVNVPTDRIFVYNGSRQSNNFTANVSGIGRSARIAISDVAFKGASLDEVRAVTGHEIGHYVLGHVWRTIILFAGLAVVFALLIDRLYPRVAARYGIAAPLSDPVGLPVVFFLVQALALLAQPFTNTLSRVDESEADRYSLQIVNLPDALASALVKTAEYRNPRPSALEETIFYSHPSVERRVRAAMQWKADCQPFGCRSDTVGK